MSHRDCCLAEARASSFAQAPARGASSAWGAVVEAMKKASELPLSEALLTRQGDPKGKRAASGRGAADSLVKATQKANELPLTEALLVRQGEPKGKRAASGRGAAGSSRRPERRAPFLRAKKRLPAPSRRRKGRAG